MTKVPTVPTNQPALWKAFGIASIPVPKLAFNRWNIVSKYLPNEVSVFVLKFGVSCKSETIL
jgi:hypothetical protein